MLERTRNDGCLSDLQMDRLMAGELAEPDAAGARRHLGGCAACAERLGQLESDRDRFRAGQPSLPRPAPDRVARPRVHRWLWPVTAAAAVAAVFLLWPRRTIHEVDRASDVTRRKGGAALGFYVKRDGEVIAGASGEVVHPGDALRFATTTSRPVHLIVAGVDAAGRVSIYFPRAERAEPIAPGADRLLPGSVVLDRSIGPELLVGLFCSGPTPVAAAREAIQRAGARPPEVPGCRADVLRLEKRAR
jgi:hypothetical protein